MSTIETDVDGENPSARIRGRWVDAPMREELQAFLDGVNGLASNASSAAQQATVAASEASADKVIVLGKAAEVATSLEETKAIANNVANSAIAIEQAKQTASQAAASAGTSALSADNSATAATTQANKAKVEADRAAAAAAQQQDLMNQHVIATNPHSQYLQDAPRDGEQYVRESGGWAKVVIPEQGVQEAPVDGKQYVRKSAAWAEVVIPESGVTEAPVDGKTYVRKDGTWVLFSGDPASLLANVPRTLSFFSTNGNGYISGSTLTRWIVDVDCYLTNNFENSQADYTIDSHYSALPEPQVISIWRNGSKIGAIQFNPGVLNGIWLLTTTPTNLMKGDKIEFIADKLVGIVSVSVNMVMRVGSA